MKSNLQTINQKLRAYRTRRGSLQDVFDEIANFEKELREILDHGVIRDHPWVAKFIKEEILGE